MTTQDCKQPQPGRARRRLAATAMVAALGLAGMLTGCNTVAGAGQDVGAVGNGVTKGADTVKSGL